MSPFYIPDINDATDFIFRIPLKVVATGLLLLFTCYKVLRICYNLFVHPLRGVPGPFIAKFSNLWQLFENIRRNEPFALKAAHERYGPIIRTGPNDLHFASPKALRQIYTQGKDAPLKTGFYKFTKPIKEDHLFSFIDKNMHLARKKLLSKCFSTTHQMKFVSGVKQLTVQLNNLISRKALENNERVVDLYHVLFQFTFESVYLLSFEEQLGMMNTGQDHTLMIMMHEGQKSQLWAVIFPILIKYGQYMPGRIGDGFRASHGWKQYYVDRMRALKKSDESPFLSQLLNTKSEEHNRPLNESEASEELMGLMFAGSETSAATMNWLLWELALNPKVQEQLFEEISQILPSPTAPIDYNIAAALPFLKAVINETLRLHTAIIGVMPRIAITDMVIDGLPVPKGTGIGMSSIVHHSDANYFVDPLCWNPSRWISGDTAVMRLAFAPFSVGPRSCLGQSLALAELTVMVTSLCRRFTFSIPEGWPALDMKPVGLFATSPRGGKNTLRVDERVV